MMSVDVNESNDSKSWVNTLERTVKYLTRCGETTEMELDRTKKELVAAKLTVEYAPIPSNDLP